MTAAPTRERESVARRSVGVVTASATFAREKVVGSLRSGDLVFAMVSPVFFCVCFYVPLHRRFENFGFDYAQYITPVIILQACIFTALVATEVAGSDARAGMHSRLMSLPIPRIAPILGRVAWSAVRLLIALAGAVAIGYALGFRFEGSFADTVLFVVLVLVFGIALCLLTDAAGSLASDSNAVAAMLMIPQLVLVMASTGLVPLLSFPGWIQPFVRNQPLSVFSDGLRALSTGGELNAGGIAAWSIGLLACGALAAAAATRAQVTR